jgi:glucose 1-dehydrogenase/2-deoxy-D-gluconate 3-dehydrogenase
MARSTLLQPFDLTNKVAVFTGAGRAIGQAIARRLAEAGAAVLVTDVDTSLAAETVAMIEKEGWRSQAFSVDVSDVVAAQQMILKAADAFGAIDILVNNADLFPPCPALDISEARWDRVLDVNLKGAFFCAQAAAKAMIAKQRRGKIINITSLGWRLPPGMLSHYDSSKGGMVSMTQSRAREVGPHGICFNAVAPGATQTPGGTAASATIASTFNADLTRLPMRAVLGRFGTGDDVAKVMYFLASGLSDHVTGSVTEVGGGYQLY